MFAKVISVVLSAAAFVIVARVLGPTNYGIYVLAIAVANFFSSVQDFGIGQSFNKFIAEYSIKKKKAAIEEMLSNGLTIILIAGTMLTIVTFMLSGIAAHEVGGGAQSIIAIQVASLIVLMVMLFSSVYPTLAGYGMGRQLAYVLAGQALIQSFASVALAVMGLGALAPLIGFEAGNAVGIVLGLYLLYSRNHLSLRMPSLGKIKSLLRFSMPLAGSNLLTYSVYYVTPVVLGVFATVVVVGNFGLAVRLNNFIGVATESLSVAILPMFSASMSIKRLRERLNRTYNHMMYLIFLVLFPMLAYIAILAKQFSYTVFGASFSLAPTYLAIMSLFTIATIFGYYTALMLIGAGKVRSVLKYNLIVAVIQILSIILLIPTFKGIGAVLSLFVVNPLLMAAVFIYGADRELGVYPDLLRLFRVVIATGISLLFIIPVMILAAGLYVPMLIASAIVLMLVYPIVLVATRVLKNEDIGTVQKITEGLPIVGSIVGYLLRYASIFLRRV